MSRLPSSAHAAARLVANVWRHPANRGARMAAVGRLLTSQARKRLMARPIDMGISSDEVLRRLDQAGYNCAIYDTTCGKLYDTTTPWELRTQNVLAVARAHRSMVEERIGSPRKDRLK